MNDFIKENVKILKEQIANIAHSVDREPEDIQLVAISKTQTLDKIREAYDAGIQCFGENKAQEFVQKFEYSDLNVVWHFVGHLQTNKIKYVLGRVALIHSIDSMHLACELSKMCVKKGLTQEILLQVNTSHEETKQGFSPMELSENLNSLEALQNIRILGLMTIGPYTADFKLIAKCFAQLRSLADHMKEMKLKNFNLQHLSMGMSNDYEIAIKEGSTMLRIGTSIFGQRN